MIDKLSWGTVVRRDDGSFQAGSGEGLLLAKPSRCSVRLTAIWIFLNHESIQKIVPFRKTLPTETLGTDHLV